MSKHFFFCSSFAACVLFLVFTGGCSTGQPTEVPGATVDCMLVNSIHDTPKTIVPAHSDAVSTDHTISEEEIKVFKNELPLSGYGYDILMNGKVYVHQPNIPAVQGNNGFFTEAAARKTAQLVLYKIRNNIMPPSIDVKELDSLDVLK